ncbi:MAG TPA: hypothetical protein VFT72_10030 [Opitutaceae bacterium]|nr:hypothetical protein [Opitutaceae bacterium]
MKSSKRDRALYGPSLFEVTLGAILSVAVGLLLGFVFLVFKPVVIVKDPPKEDERDQNTVYYVTGSSDSSRARQSDAKFKRLAAGTPGEISFTEEDLNVWLAAQAPERAKKKPAPPPPPKKGAKAAPAPAEPVPDETFTFDLPNVRIRDGVFQVGIPGSINLITFSVPVVLQAQGGFEQSDDMWVFHPRTIYLGSMPLHRIPHMTEMLMNKITRSNAIPEDALDAWKHVSNVTLEGKVMEVTVKSEG